MPATSQCRASGHSHITSRTRDLPTATRSMKHPTAGRSERRMRFFRPELYLRYNATDDAEANLADEEWEHNLRAYKKYLSEHSKDMNERVKELTESLSLHDAELLSIQEDVPDSDFTPPFFPLPVATLSVQGNGKITNIVYFLWSHVEQSCPGMDWPFSEIRTYWLYDELEVERQPPNGPRYWHHILWSNGRIISVPFFDVIVQSFSPLHPETAVIAKKRA